VSGRKEHACVRKREMRSCDTHTHTYTTHTHIDTFLHSHVHSHTHAQMCIVQVNAPESFRGVCVRA